MYRAGQAIASTVPAPVLFPAASLAGLIAGRLNKRKRDVVRRNIRRAAGEDHLEQLVDDAFRSYSRYWVETLRIPKPGSAEIARRTSVEGLEKVEPYIAAGRGVIFVIPHIGSWDIAGAWIAARGWRVVAIAERLEPPALYDLFVRLRRAVGVEIHPLGSGASARAVLDALRKGAVVGLAADRDLPGTGVEVDFMGERTTLPAGPAVLAMRTGAVLVAGALYQAPRGRYVGVVMDPIPVTESRSSRASPDETRRLTQLVANDLETLIRREPGQWHLFQPNWPSDPGYGRSSAG
jgi:KDO2-lipid IV(A) lauroyltransferase